MISKLLKRNAYPLNDGKERGCEIYYIDRPKLIFLLLVTHYNEIAFHLFQFYSGTKIYVCMFVNNLMSQRNFPKKKESIELSSYFAYNNFELIKTRYDLEGRNVLSTTPASVVF
mgnify:CR=1 FL=1